MKGIGLHEVIGQPSFAQAFSYFRSEVILSDAARDTTSTSKQVRAVCEISRCTAELPTGWQEIPENFTKSDKDRGLLHAMLAGAFAVQLGTRPLFFTQQLSLGR
jgi:hypothetical protein